MRRKTKGDSDPDAFSSSKWASIAQSSMFKATAALDRLCHTIVHVKQFYPRGPVAESLRELALTASVFDPALFSYAFQIQQLTDQCRDSKSRSPAPHSPPPKPTTKQISQGSKPAGSVPLKDSSINSPTPSTSPVKTSTSPPPPLPLQAVGARAAGTATMGDMNPQWALWQLQSGGFVSLMELLGSTLGRVAHTVRRLRDLSSFQAYMANRNISVTLLTSITGLYYAQSYFFPHLPRRLLRRLLGNGAETLALGLPHYTRYLVIPAICYYMYKRAKRALLGQLEREQKRLLTLLRLWQICMSKFERDLRAAGLMAVGRGGGRRGRRRAKAVATASSLVTFMMAKVPPALDSSFWYQTNDRLHYLKMSLDASYSTIEVWYSIFGAGWAAAPLMTLVAFYYLFNRKQAAYKASQLLSAPDILLVKKIWEVLDNRVISWILWAIFRRKQVNVRNIKLRKSRREPSKSVIPSAAGIGLEPRGGGDQKVREGSMLSIGSEEAMGGEGDGHGLKWSQHMLSSDSFDGVPVLRRPIRFWLASSDPLDFVKHRTSIGSPSVGSPSAAVPVVMYLHGGGFVGSFRASERRLAEKWADDTRALVVYVDYSLSPESKYPTPLEESYAIYRYVTEGRLGVKPTSVVIVAESNGGTLAAGVCIRAIQDGVKVPNGLVLGYPVLSMESTLTASRALFMMDPIAPMNLISQCRTAYLPSKPRSDPALDLCISPLLASDAVLAKFPPTDIMVGSFDPFLDDSVHFAQRLSANGVGVRFRRFKNVPHAFWCFQPALVEAQEGIELAGEWIQSYFVWDAVEPHRRL